MRATFCSFGPVRRGATRNSAPRTPIAPRRVYIPLACRSSPRAASRRSGRMATATPPRAVPPGVDFPIHALTLNAMGLHLLDYLEFEGLLAACERLARWEFLFFAAPLRVTGGTGSPLNPIAIL